MLKKVVLSTVIATLVASNVLACEYSCPSGSYSIVNNYNTTNVVNNYGVMNYYSNSGSGYQANASYECNYEATAEYDNSYCHLCGLGWDLCTCYDDIDYDYGYDTTDYSGCGYDYDNSYSDYDCSWDGSSSEYYDCYSGGSASGYCSSYFASVSGISMAHWANMRDAAGNIIGCVDAGASVQIIGTCEDNPARTLIYDYSTGCYGTVASCYLYGASDYIYENPTEWGGYSGYGSCHYGDSSGCSMQEVIYDETTRWAADNLDCCYYDSGSYDWVEYDHDEDSCHDYYDSEYTECYDECLYSDDDCGMYFLNDGIISNSNINIKIDLSNSVINIYSGDQVLLSGNCDCSGLSCGDYSYCADFSGYCGGFGGMIPNGCDICVRN